MSVGLNGFTARGATGSLRVAGREAARLGAWTLIATTGDGAGGGTWRATAAITVRDPYWIDAGHPFALQLTLGTHTWRFSPADIQVDISGDTATITGSTPPEEY